MPRPVHKNAKGKRAFLASFAKFGTITKAAKAAKVCRTTVRNWQLADPEFVKAMEAAHEEACEFLEQAARQRAVEGVLRPVYQGGKKVGSVREYSDTLLIFLMKGAMPDKYRDRQAIEHSGGLEIDGQLRVLESDDWYDSGKNHHAPEGPAPSDSDPALPGPDEGGGVRPAVG